MRRNGWRNVARSAVALVLGEVCAKRDCGQGSTPRLSRAEEPPYEIVTQSSRRRQINAPRKEPPLGTSNSDPLRMDSAQRRLVGSWARQGARRRLQQRHELVTRDGIAHKDDFAMQRCAVGLHCTATRHKAHPVGGALARHARALSRPAGALEPRALQRTQRVRARQAMRGLLVGRRSCSSRWLRVRVLAANCAGGALAPAAVDVGAPTEGTRAGWRTSQSSWALLSPKRAAAAARARVRECACSLLLPLGVHTAVLRGGGCAAHQLSHLARLESCELNGSQGAVPLEAAVAMARVAGPSN